MIAARAYLPPIAVLNSAARGIGYVDYDADSDGVLRSEIAVIRFGKRYCVPLYLALTAAYLKNAPLRLVVGADGVRQVTLGDEEIPVDEIGRMLIDFRGPPGTFPAYSISDLIAHRVPPAAVAGKIVLVGLTAHALGDRKVTPTGGRFSGRRDPRQCDRQRAPRRLRQALARGGHRRRGRGGAGAGARDQRGRGLSLAAMVGGEPRCG